MPKLWKATIAEHRRDVREAIMDATWSLVRERGLLSVTMSQIAQATGIGRATLYKYFPDVEAILTAWHEDRITGHLAALAAISEQGEDVRDRLEALLTAYAHICQTRANHGAQDLGAVLHRREQIASAEQRLHHLFGMLIAEGAAAGAFRDDVPAEELTNFCVHALSAAGALGSEDAVRRLVEVTLGGVIRGG